MKNLILSVMAAALSLAATAQPKIEVAKYLGDRQAAISYTFDDGLLEHYTLVFPQLKKHGLKASFCIIGSKIGHDMKGTPCMTFAQLREMAADGQEITSHGWSHKAVTKITGEALRHEVQHNDTVIMDSVGVFPRTFFYPGNRKTREAMDVCSRDRVGTRTFQASIGSKRDSAWLRRWIDGIVQRGEWGVGMTHGITRGYDAFKNPQILWSHFSYAASLKDKLWIATFHDVAAYIRERDDIKLKVRHKKTHIEVKPRLGLDKGIFNMPLTLVVRATRHITAEQDGKRLTTTVKGDRQMFDFDPCGGKITIRYE